MRYYAYLFDIEKAKKAVEGTKKAGEPSFPALQVCTIAHYRVDEVQALENRQYEFLQTMTKAVNKYLDQNGRRWVDLGALVSVVKIA